MKYFSEICGPCYRKMTVFKDPMKWHFLNTMQIIKYASFRNLFILKKLWRKLKFPLEWAFLYLLALFTLSWHTYSCICLRKEFSSFQFCLTIISGWNSLLILRYKYNIKTYPFICTQFKYFSHSTISTDRTGRRKLSYLTSEFLEHFLLGTENQPESH